jgi:hypothetical protein
MTPHKYGAVLDVISEIVNDPQRTGGILGRCTAKLSSRASSCQAAEFTGMSFGRLGQKSYPRVLPNVKSWLY